VDGIFARWTQTCIQYPRAAAGRVDSRLEAPRPDIWPHGKRSGSLLVAGQPLPRVRRRRPAQENRGVRRAARRRFARRAESDGLLEPGRRNYFRRLRSRSSAASVGVGGRAHRHHRRRSPARRRFSHFSYFPAGRPALPLLPRGGPEVTGIYVGSLDAKPEEQKRERLLATRFVVAYTPSQDPVGGRLFFMRESTLMVQPFDAGRLNSPASLSRSPNSWGALGFTDFFQSLPAALWRIVPAPKQRASNSPGSTGRERPWVRSGISVPTRALPSPRTERGQRSAMLFTNVRGDIWTLDFARGVRTRFHVPSN